MSEPMEPTYPDENHECPVCKARAWQREVTATCSLKEYLDERGVTEEWNTEDICENENSDVYLTCEEGHIWIEASREIIDGTDWDGQTDLLAKEAQP